MTLADALRGVSLLFLNTAPVIYQVEQNPAYSALAGAVFQEIDTGRVGAVTSPVTLAECLVSLQDSLRSTDKCFYCTYYYWAKHAVCGN